MFEEYQKKPPEIVELPDRRKAVCIHAERTNGAAGILYYTLSGGGDERDLPHSRRGRAAASTPHTAHSPRPGSSEYASSSPQSW